MKAKLSLLLALLVWEIPAFSHRLDEYLQAILVSIDRDQIHAAMRLIPGIAVSTAVIADIDSNKDGAFSQAEQHAYAEKVLRDLSLNLDGQTLMPHLEHISFPSTVDMKEGLGEIHIDFSASLPAGGVGRTLVIQNHYEPRISVYLVNCLMSPDASILLMEQSRNQTQSYYRVQYRQTDLQANTLLWYLRTRLMSAIGLFGAVPGLFRLGVRHIAEGTDHLLFLLALLLPAPLITVRSRWTEQGGVRHTLVQVLRVVTAFTLGHSLTLALGASGLISLSSRLVEVLIAFSILVSAVHALRPLFPGREPVVAALFGLIHGLAFATTLQNLGVSPWQRIAGILGFNLGIETMQLVVVAAILPSLVVLSRTPAYTTLRLTGALFAAAAALGWIAERLLGLHTPVDAVVDCLAQHGAWIAASLLVVSVTLWFGRFRPAERRNFSSGSFSGGRVRELFRAWPSAPAE